MQPVGVAWIWIASVGLLLAWLPTLAWVALLLVALHARRGRPLRLPGLGSCALLACGMAAGSVAAGSWTSPQPQPSPSPSEWLCFGFAIPVLEERLYREQLLDALRGWAGTAPAIFLSALVFALMHAAPEVWGVAFLGGIACAGLRLASGSLALPIGLHIGWNLAATA